MNWLFFAEKKKKSLRRLFVYWSSQLAEQLGAGQKLKIHAAHFCHFHFLIRIMASDNGNAEDTSQHENGSQGSQSPGGGAAPDAEEEKPVGGGVVSEQLEPFNNIPVFLDRTYRMVENVPDDIVCWSDAGDSFIIKQASEKSGTGAGAWAPKDPRRCVFARLLSRKTWKRRGWSFGLSLTTTNAPGNEAAHLPRPFLPGARRLGKS